MSDDDHSRPRWPLHHVLLLVVSAVLAAGGLILMSLQFAIPDVRGLTGLGAACTIVGSVVVASTLGQRKTDRVRHEMRDVHDAVKLLHDEILANRVVAEEVRELTLTRVELSAQAIRAEARDMFDKGMAEARMTGLFEISERLAAMTSGLAKRIDALAVQQETLAEIVSDPARVVLAMPDSELYEMGRRDGQAEMRREKEA
jgi:hypothetical protein